MSQRLQQAIAQAERIDTKKERKIVCLMSKNGKLQIDPPAKAVQQNRISE